MRAVHLTKLAKLAFEWHYCLSNLIYDGLEVEKERLGDSLLGFQSGLESQRCFVTNSIIYYLDLYSYSVYNEEMK